MKFFNVTPTFRGQFAYSMLYFTIYLSPLLFLSLIDNLLLIFPVFIWLMGTICKAMNYLFVKKMYKKENEIILEVGNFKFSYAIENVRLTLENSVSKFGSITYFLYLRKHREVYPKLFLGKIILDVNIQLEDVKNKMKEIEDEFDIVGFDLQLY